MSTNPELESQLSSHMDELREAGAGGEAERLAEIIENPDAAVPVSPNGFFSTYYPLFWISRWLSPFDTYNVFVALHLILAATGVGVLSLMR